MGLILSATFHPQDSLVRDGPFTAPSIVPEACPLHGLQIPKQPKQEMQRCSRRPEMGAARFCGFRYQETRITRKEVGGKESREKKAPDES